MTELRWELADADQTQGALWTESIFEREPGRGEFRGMEFLHVKARTIINEIKGGDGYLPFRYTINAYRGCSHACTYCFARPTHAYLNLDTGRDFERRIVVKVNAVERLRIEVDRRRWAGEHIAMGTNTDPYQRCEGKYRLTRGIVEVLAGAANPFSILTKGTLVLRDLDLLAEAATRTSVRVNLSIGTLDEEVWKATEPGTPHPLQRVRAVAQLNQAGVPCGVLVAPVLPGLSDRVDQLEAVVAACLDAGAVSISTVLLHLRPGVKENYLDSLGATHPQLVRPTQRLYGARSRAPTDDQRRVADLVHELVRRRGGITAPRLDPRHLIGRASPTPVPAPVLGRRRAGPVEGQLNLL